MHLRNAPNHWWVSNLRGALVMDLTDLSPWLLTMYVCIFSYAAVASLTASFSSMACPCISLLRTER